jgi:hypothetical protein
MKSITIAATIFAFASFVASSPPPVPTAGPNGGPPFDPAGQKNVGNKNGEQFIGGQCLSDADCASKCCAGPSGICSGPGASTQNGKTGCHFGGGPSLSTPASSSPAPPPPTASNGGPPFDPAGQKNVGNQKFMQFIGGQCINDADCASKCCAGPSGICSGPGASTQNGKTGCNFIAKRSVSVRSSLGGLD